MLVFSLAGAPLSVSQDATRAVNLLYCRSPGNDAQISSLLRCNFVTSEAFTLRQPKCPYIRLSCEYWVGRGDMDVSLIFLIHALYLGPLPIRHTNYTYWKSSTVYPIKYLMAGKHFSLKTLPKMSLRDIRFTKCTRSKPIILTCRYTKKNPHKMDDSAKRAEVVSLLQNILPWSFEALVLLSLDVLSPTITR